MTIRSLVNYIMWSDRRDECYLVIEDRLVAMSERVIRARDIVRVDSSYIYLEGGSVIPLHRIRRIVCGEEVLLSR